jgi:hypothetical protein
VSRHSQAGKEKQKVWMTGRRRPSPCGRSPWLAWPPFLWRRLMARCNASRSGSRTEARRVCRRLKEDGPDGLAREIRSSGAVGYLHWPGSLDYTLRYAYHVPRPEGGQDLVLATDSPVQEWWESGHSMPASNSGITAIQLRLNNDGQGEGKLAMPTKVTAGRGAKTFLLADYDKQPVALTDVRRDRVTG